MLGWGSEDNNGQVLYQFLACLHGLGKLYARKWEHRIDKMSSKLFSFFFFPPLFSFASLSLHIALRIDKRGEMQKHYNIRTQGVTQSDCCGFPPSPLNYSSIREQIWIYNAVCFLSYPSSRKHQSRRASIFSPWEKVWMDGWVVYFARCCISKRNLTQNNSSTYRSNPGPAYRSCTHL